MVLLVCPVFALSVLLLPCVAIWLGQRARHENESERQVARALAIPFFFVVLNVSACAVWGGLGVPQILSGRFIAAGLFLLNVAGALPIVRLATHLPPKPKRREWLTFE